MISLVLQFRGHNVRTLGPLTTTPLSLSMILAAYLGVSTSIEPCYGVAAETSYFEYKYLSMVG